MPNRFHYFSVLFTACLCIISCKEQSKTSENIKATINKPIQIAFLADVHIQDIYSTYTDTTYQGILNPKTNKYNTIRTMEAQLHSTRIFNENYFAFIAALEDLGKRGITYVAFPGDFSDDGQPVNIKAFKRITDLYQKKYNMQFFAITGNHDPVRPYTRAAGKSDFLGNEGQAIGVFSNKNLSSKTEIVTKDIQNWGYKEILETLAPLGFSPKATNLYWETPFTTYDYDHYSYEKAKENADIHSRMYDITGTSLMVPDASYLVEPIEGLWLLAIDANVYIPKEEHSKQPENPDDFNGAGIGYNDVVTHKKHLLPWIRKISKEAKIRNKTLIAFSHYPAMDFNDNATQELRYLFGEHKMQMQRVPNETIAPLMANLGVQVHVAGHMHMNDTGAFTSKEGNSIVNIQVPSLAAYIPGYKIVTVKEDNSLEVETVVVDHVPNFNELFPLYEKELIYLQEHAPDQLWNKDILKAETYKDFTEWHLRELVRLRFLPNDWPNTFSTKLLPYSGKTMLTLNTDKSKITELLSDTHLQLSDFDSWNAMDMIIDFYRLKSGDDIAKKDIGNHQLLMYKLVCQELKKSKDADFRMWGTIFSKMMNGQPSDHFSIDLINGKVTPIYN